MTTKKLARVLIFLTSASFAVSLSLMRRETGTAYSSEDQKAILEVHNYYRSKVSPTATNMEEMKWDSVLAKQAQDWADTCVYEHPNKTIHKDYIGIGQNLYAIYNVYGLETAKPDATEPVESWHSEVQYYYYEYNACVVDEVCGHYTQVVWADTTDVGCGINYCLSAKYDNTALPNAWIVVCNYSPGGNYIGQWPYETGEEQCSQCSDGRPCKNGLCSDCSPQNDPDCECKIKCQNCGSVQSSDLCECLCPDGYFGEFCEEFCEDKHYYCGANPGWPTRWCNDSSYWWVDEYCPLMCGLCTNGTQVDPANC
ncbi:Peptidase inhibitor 16 [Holothuria leucospilota]|uniref:Peptidase inhibitor 16 n=1 Tax=Holothuria leucospilota TaxID=206669 RepID=A0A9Q0YJD5_HOLLE|nr:Peptidase inhibitor 16 [Holothuria leucospilota]